MADPKYEIDSEGNLVPSGGDPAVQNTVAKDGEEAVDRPVTATDRRRFLNALIASDVIGVLVLGGSGLLLPESRTLLLILAVLYAVAGVFVYIWMSRTTQRKVEESRERPANG